MLDSWKGIPDHPATEQLHCHGNLLWRSHNWGHHHDRRSPDKVTSSATAIRPVPTRQLATVSKVTVPETAKCWPEILSRESIQDWLQPRLQVPVSARTQTAVLGKQTLLLARISRPRIKSRSGNASAPDIFWNVTPYKLWIGRVSQRWPRLSSMWTYKYKKSQTPQLTAETQVDSPTLDPVRTRKIKDLMMEWWSQTSCTAVISQRQHR